jgi:hypothetical protein
LGSLHNLLSPWFSPQGPPTVGVFASLGSAAGKAALEATRQAVMMVRTGFILSGF